MQLDIEVWMEFKLEIHILEPLACKGHFKAQVYVRLTV